MARFIFFGSSIVWSSSASPNLHRSNNHAKHTLMVDLSWLLRRGQRHSSSTDDSHPRDVEHEYDNMYGSPRGRYTIGKDGIKWVWRLVNLPNWRLNASCSTTWWWSTSTTSIELLDMDPARADDFGLLARRRHMSLNSVRCKRVSTNSMAALRVHCD